MMVDEIEKLYVTKKEGAHRIRKNDANKMRFKTGISINYYMLVHSGLRRKIYQVGYPHITSEETKVRCG